MKNTNRDSGTDPFIYKRTKKKTKASKTYKGFGEIVSKQDAIKFLKEHSDKTNVCHYFAESDHYTTKPQYKQAKAIAHNLDMDLVVIPLSYRRAIAALDPEDYGGKNSKCESIADAARILESCDEEK